MKNKKLVEDAARLERLNDNLAHAKNVYNRFIGVLTNYSIQDAAYTAIYYDELFHKQLEVLINNKDDDSLVDLMFGDYRNLSEIEKVNIQIKYYEDLTKHIKSRILNFSPEVKKKIAEDSIRKEKDWFELVDKNIKRTANKMRKKGARK
jgi:hypothetical protein